MDSWTADIWNSNEDECKRTLNEPGNWEKVIKFYCMLLCKMSVRLRMKNENHFNLFHIYL